MRLLETVVLSSEKKRVLVSQLDMNSRQEMTYPLSRALRDIGLEIIFGGHQECEQMIETAIQEDVDLIYLNCSLKKSKFYREEINQLLNKKNLLGSFIIYFNKIFL